MGVFLVLLIVQEVPNHPKRLTFCNHIMKFGQLIEYNMRNTFLEKLYTKCDGNNVPRSLNNQNGVYL